MTSCVDCPYLSNSTPKRPVCCMDAGARRKVMDAARRVNEAIGDVPLVKAPGVRASALSGTLLGSALAGGFAPEVWDGRPRLAAPLTPEEAVRASTRRVR